MTSSPGTQQTLLTVGQAAERLGISERTARRMLADGRLPALRLGLPPRSPVRIDADELDAWLRGDPEDAA